VTPEYNYAVDCDNYVITVCETMLKLVLLVTLIAAILPTDGEFYSSSESLCMAIALSSATYSSVTMAASAVGLWVVPSIAVPPDEIS